MQKINDFEIEELDSFPAGENPFNHDLFNMGTQIGENVWIMHSNFPKEKMKFMIIVDQKTGKRIRICFPREK